MGLEHKKVSLRNRLLRNTVINYNTFHQSNTKNRANTLLIFNQSNRGCLGSVNSRLKSLSEPDPVIDWDFCSRTVGDDGTLVGCQHYMDV